MSNSRRDFLKMSSLSALAFTTPVKNLSSFLPESLLNKKMNSFGIQLWTVREAMTANAKDTLKRIAGFGYNQIESFEGKDGMFWGMPHKEFKKYLDEVGTSIISSHCDISKNFEQKAAQAAEIGMKYLICPWKGPQKSIDTFKKFAEDFNKCGEICKKNGIRFAYHNHDYSFKEVDGQLPQEVMMNNTDKNLVDFEMDIYWVVAAGANPQEWFKKYKNRFRLCHVKDRLKNPPLNGSEGSCIVGTGSIDFPAILKTAADNGMQYFIVEQEAFAETTPLKSAEANAAYMKMLNIK